MSTLDKNQQLLHRNFSNESYLGNAESIERLIDWTTFYRRNLHRFAQHYLGLSLHLYQIIIIYLMNLFPTFCIVAARAAAKSYLIAIFACCKAILYPHSQIVIASGTKRQSKIIVSEKIRKELMRDSANLKREIVSFKDNTNDIEVVFRNGSSIIVVPASDNARGFRSTCEIFEEFRQIKKDVIDSILSPFLIVRPAPFLKKEEYAYLREEPIEIYISSSWFKSHWMWEIMKTFLKDQFKNNSSCVLAMDYSITLKHNLRTRKQLIKERKKLDPISWAIEYENQMIAENVNAYFTYRMLSENQRLRKPFYPRTTIDYLSKKKNPYLIPKQDGEIRVISCDMAFVEGKANDNSIFTCIRLLPESMHYTSQSIEGSHLEVKQGYRRLIPYIEGIQGGDTTKQAIRIKQLYEDFDADYVVLDMRNGGINVYDLLAKVMYDEERDKEYPPWVCMNDDATANRIKINGALPILFAVVASQKLNSDIAVAMRSVLMDKKIDLLISHNEAVEDILSKFSDYMSGDTEMQVFYEIPFLETQALINEMIELVYEKKEQTGLVVISEQGANRKDRYTSISYGNYFASLLEQDLLSETSDYDFVFTYS